MRYGLRDANHWWRVGWEGRRTEALELDGKRVLARWRGADNDAETWCCPPLFDAGGDAGADSRYVDEGRPAKLGKKAGIGLSGPSHVGLAGFED